MEPRPDSLRENQPKPLDVPPNPYGGRTLIVDARDPAAYVRPSAALIEAGEEDQVFVRPGMYEDKVFVSERPVRLIGAGRDYVQIFCRRGGPLYLQRVSSGIISGLTFRYVGSDQHSAINVLDSNLLITQSRALEGVLSGVVIYGPECRVNFHDNEVCHNRESGIFVFAGAQPRVSNNCCFGNHHFGIAIRDPGSHPEIVRNICYDNMMSGILLFHHAAALMLHNESRDNQHWGVVMTSDAQPVPAQDELVVSNTLMPNPRGPLFRTDQPLEEIGR